MGMVQEAIRDGRTVMGIEFGSTRIKAVLTDEKHEVIATGIHDWENRLEDHIWTYSIQDIWEGLQACYADLAAEVKKNYQVELTSMRGIGFSAMMHGYMAFDEKDTLLVPFRTWRNTITEEASSQLTGFFSFNIPQRWSVSHFYQAMLNGEEHVKKVAFLTTLSGYVHWKLTGRKVLGIGDASGMFPIDSQTGDYQERMLKQFDSLSAEKGYTCSLRKLLPKVLTAGEDAGVLTKEGALLLDPSGKLQPGVPLCPPEGDAGTGMTATNSVAVRTGNVSAGTSVFAMVVLEKELQQVHEEIDMVTTPDGSAVAMVHCNNCTSDLDAWMNLFSEVADSLGRKVDRSELYGSMYRKALEADADCGGLMAYNYYAGEPITGLGEGRPLFLRRPDAGFTLANFMRTHLYSALATLKIGMDILIRQEHVAVDFIMGHGGLFKTPVVGQKIMAAALNVPVTCMDTAAEGGAWGMALLAHYMLEKQENETLSEYLNTKVFAGRTGTTVAPVKEEVSGFDAFMEAYKACLPAEKSAVECFKS